MKRVLLILPTSTYRTRDFMEAAGRLGVEVAVASEEPSTMERLSPQGLMTLDLLDPTRAVERAASFHERWPIDAIVAVDEDSALVAAAIGRRLGLPHNPPEAAARARAKHRMRHALAEAGVPSPGYRVLEATDDPREAAKATTYPAVVKPVFLSGSRGVVRVDDERGLVERTAWLRNLLSTPELKQRGGEDAGRILIEDFVPGLEVAVEGLLTDGALRPLAVFDKPDPLDGPFFEETIYVTPSRLPSRRQDDILHVTGRAARAIGLRHGAVHAELRLPGEGAPVVIEIAGRSIGGLCSRTLRFGLGMSLEELVLRHALGEDVADIERESRASGGVLGEIRGLERARAVEGIVEITMTAHAGQRLVALPEASSYLGFIFARRATPAEVEGALRRAHGEIELYFEGE
jgi:biotin carboxylase